MERKADIEAEIVRACVRLRTPFPALWIATRDRRLTISLTPIFSSQEGHRGRLEAVRGSA